MVPLPPPVRRRAAGAPARRAAGPGSAAAPARQPVVRAPRPHRGGGQARLGRAGLRPRGPPDRAGRAGDPPPPAGSGAARLAAGTARRRRPAQPGAQRLLRIHADGLRRPRGVRGPTRRRGTRAGCRTRRGRRPPWADTEELRTLPATIAIYRASLAQARGDVAGTAEHARRALDLAGPDDHLARGGAAGFLGLAAWATGRRDQRAGDVHAGGGEPARGRQPRRRAEQHGRARRPVARGGPTEQGAPALPGCAAAGRGTRRARGARNAPTCTWGSARSTSRSATSRAPDEHLQIAAALGEPVADEREPLPVVRGHGPARRRRGRPARRPSPCLDQAEQLYRPGFFPDVRPIAAIKARVWIAQGKLSRGRRLGP